MYFKKILFSLFSILIVSLICIAPVVSAYQSPKNPTRIACIGDSLTYGGSNEEESSKNSYPAQLQTMLGNDYIVNNYGYNGACVEKSADIPYWNLQQYSDINTFNPDVVIIMLGTNDSKPYNWNEDNFCIDYSDLIHHFKTMSSSPQIYILTSPKVIENKYDIDKKIISDMIVPLQIKIATDCQCGIIDLYDMTTDMPSTYYCDGVHFTTDGYYTIAAIINEYIFND